MGTIEISREELAEAYENETVESVLERFGISNTASLYRLLDRAGIPRKDPGKSGKARKTYTLSE